MNSNNLADYQAPDLKHQVDTVSLYHLDYNKFDSPRIRPCLHKKYQNMRHVTTNIEKIVKADNEKVKRSSMIRPHTQVASPVCRSHKMFQSRRLMVTTSLPSSRQKGGSQIYQKDYFHSRAQRKRFIGLIEKFKKSANSYNPFEENRKSRILKRREAHFLIMSTNSTHKK